jgi:hypothetical protein
VELSRVLAGTRCQRAVRPICGGASLACLPKHALQMQLLCRREVLRRMFMILCLYEGSGVLLPEEPGPPRLTPSAGFEIALDTAGDDRYHKTIKDGCGFA